MALHGITTEELRQLTEEHANTRKVLCVPQHHPSAQDTDQRQNSHYLRRRKGCAMARERNECEIAELRYCTELQGSARRRQIRIIQIFIKPGHMRILLRESA